MLRSHQGAARGDSSAPSRIQESRGRALEPRTRVARVPQAGEAEAMGGFAGGAQGAGRSAQAVGARERARAVRSGGDRRRPAHGVPRQVGPPRRQGWRREGRRGRERGGGEEERRVRGASDDEQEDEGRGGRRPVLALRHQQREEGEEKGKGGIRGTGGAQPQRTAQHLVRRVPALRQALARGAGHRGRGSRHAHLAQGEEGSVFGKEKGQKGAHRRRTRGRGRGRQEGGEQGEEGRRQ